MIFGKKDTLAGLDIGSRTIKVAEMDTSSGYALTKFGMMDITPGMIGEDGIKDHDGVAAAIKELFKKNKIKESNVAISVGGYSVIVKKINVQQQTEEQLQEAISHEAEQYIPFDIKEVNLDFQILGTSEHNPNQMNVLLVAAKKDMINDYMTVLEIAGLNPCVIDIDAFALQNIFEVNYELDANKCAALIDVGSAKTSLNIIKGSESVFTRDVSLGCNQINLKIMDQVGCTLEEAEELKFSDKQDRIAPEELKRIVSEVVSDWSTEIRRALDFYYSQFQDDRIDKISLSGGGANIEGFRKILATQTGTQVDVINPFEKVKIADSKFDREFLIKAGPQAAICMGLATRRVGDK
jgi:type IV pilus assembly protein PilM